MILAPDGLWTTFWPSSLVKQNHARITGTWEPAQDRLLQSELSGLQKPPATQQPQDRQTGNATKCGGCWHEVALLPPQQILSWPFSDSSPPATLIFIHCPAWWPWLAYSSRGVPFWTSILFFSFLFLSNQILFILQMFQFLATRSASAGRLVVHHDGMYKPKEKTLQAEHDWFEVLHSFLLVMAHHNCYLLISQENCIWFRFSKFHETFVLVWIPPSMYL